LPTSIFDQAMVFQYIICISTSGTDIENQEMAYGTALLVLILWLIPTIGECTRKYYGKVK
jgi:hypothetical protein